MIKGQSDIPYVCNCGNILYMCLKTREVHGGPLKLCLLGYYEYVLKNINLWCLVIFINEN